jgi:hypothetical protein
MSFEVRNSLAVAAAEGVEANASLSRFGDQFGMSLIDKLVLQGAVFLGGYGIEATDTDGAAALDDTTPTFVLAAPTNGLIVLPLWVRLQITTEGGAAPDAYLTYVSNATDTPISNSGTAIDAVLNCLGGAQRDSQASFLHTVTSGAITSTQNVVLWQTKDMPDDILSVVAVDVDGGSVETPNNAVSAVTIPLYPQVPIALRKGTSLNFYSVTGTTDSKWRPTFCWAEIPDTII